MKRATAGFTLIEVVVAFALLSVVLVTVFEIFSTGLARAGELEHHSRALLIAQSKLAAAGVEEALAEGQTTGESEDRQYRWSLSIQRSAEGADPGRPTPSPYSLYRVEARVAWQGRTGVERDLALSTLRIAQNK